MVYEQSWGTNNYKPPPASIGFSLFKKPPPIPLTLLAQKAITDSGTTGLKPEKADNGPLAKNREFQDKAITSSTSHEASRAVFELGNVAKCSANAPEVREDAMNRLVEISINPTIDVHRCYYAISELSLLGTVEKLLEAYIRAPQQDAERYDKITDYILSKFKELLKDRSSVPSVYNALARIEAYSKVIENLVLLEQTGKGNSGQADGLRGEIKEHMGKLHSLEGHFEIAYLGINVLDATLSKSVIETLAGDRPSLERIRDSTSSVNPIMHDLAKGALERIE